MREIGVGRASIEQGACLDETASEPHTTDAQGAVAEPCAAHGTSAVNTLRQAMRRASVDNAERAGVVSDLRAASLARLGLLQDALEPLVAQIPRTVDLFDMAVLPGLTPRLFIDVIGFVEMGRDARAYRFFQDTRHGRELIVESADIDRLVDAVTDYVARRLVERERALEGSSSEARASASSSEARSSASSSEARAAMRSANEIGAGHAKPGGPAKPGPSAAGLADIGAPGARPGSPLAWLSAAFWFLIHVLGSITFFLLLAFACWLIWNGLHKPI